VLQLEGTPPRYLRGGLVSADYFSVLDLRMAMGRAFTRAEEAGVGLVVVVSYRVWREAFASTREIVGRRLTLNGLVATVVGVAPPGFQGIQRLSDEDVWVPGSAVWGIAHFPGNPPSPLHQRETRIFPQLVARLMQGARMQQAATQMRLVISSLPARASQGNANGPAAAPDIRRLDGLPGPARSTVRRVITALVAAAGMLLILACANVANLFLFRSATRQGEWAVRRALGAGDGAVIRSHVVEALVLTTLAAGAGLALHGFFTSLFKGMPLPGTNPMAGKAVLGALPLDWTIIAVASTVAVAAGVILGLVAGGASTRADLLESLKTLAAAGRSPTRRFRSTLVAGQLAVSTALLVVSLLLLKSRGKLLDVPVGFDARQVTAFAISPSFSGYDHARSQAALRMAASQIRSIPGVEDATLTAYTPFSVTIFDRLQQPGVPSSDAGAPAVSAWVGPGYFTTMGIPFLTGRDFTEDEAFAPVPPGAENVGILSASQARGLFASVDVVGRVVQGQGAARSYRVVGVVQDTRWAGLSGVEVPPFYQPLPPWAEGGTVLVRSRLAAGELRRAVENAVGSVAPGVPVFDVERLDDKVTRSIADSLLLSRTVLTFTVLAVVIAGAGLYAVVAFSVAERAREFSIRVAFGAEVTRLVGLVLRQALWVGSTGLIGGLILALWLARLAATRLYEVSQVDPMSYATAGVVVAIVVFLGTLVPAVRAARADAMTALRAE
jgi:predicted permease